MYDKVLLTPILIALYRYSSELLSAAGFSTLSFLPFSCGPTVVMLWCMQTKPTRESLAMTRANKSSEYALRQAIETGDTQEVSSLGCSALLHLPTLLRLPEGMVRVVRNIPPVAAFGVMH